MMIVVYNIEDALEPSRSGMLRKTRLASRVFLFFRQILCCFFFSFCLSSWFIINLKTLFTIFLKSLFICSIKEKAWKHKYVKRGNKSSINLLELKMDRVME